MTLDYELVTMFESLDAAGMRSPDADRAAMINQWKAAAMRNRISVEAVRDFAVRWLDSGKHWPKISDLVDFGRGKADDDNLSGTGRWLVRVLHSDDGSEVVAAEKRMYMEGRYQLRESETPCENEAYADEVVRQWGGCGVCGKVGRFCQCGEGAR